MTLLDGIVLARSVFEHSMNYRSVVVLGTATPGRRPGGEARALEAFTEKLLPGRWEEARRPPKELKATSVLSLPLDEASAKIRDGGPEDGDTPDAELDVWAGYLPARRAGARAGRRPDAAPRDPGASGLRPVPTPGLVENAEWRDDAAAVRHGRDEVRRLVRRRPGEDPARRARFVDANAAGSNVVGTVSAMGKTTDSLLALANEVSPTPNPRELDMLLSTGERIACALVAMAIHDLGEEAVSYTGSQAGILTDSAHTQAKIREIRGDRIRGVARAGEDRPRRRVPGLLARHDGHHDARARRHRRDRRRARGRARRRLRDLLDVAGVFTADPRIVPERASSPSSRTTRCSRWRPRARRC